MEATATGL